MLTRDELRTAQWLYHFLDLFSLVGDRGWFLELFDYRRRASEAQREEIEYVDDPRKLKKLILIHRNGGCCGPLPPGDAAECDRMLQRVDDHFGLHGWPRSGEDLKALRLEVFGFPIYRTGED